MRRQYLNQARLLPGPIYIYMGDLCSISAKQVDPRLDEYKDLPHMNGENIESGSGRIQNVKTSAELGMRSGKYLFKSGDVLYSKLGPYLRKAACVDFMGLCSADMYPLTPRAGRVTQHFLCLLLLSPAFTKYADDESKRSRMPKLNRKQLMIWRQPVPSVDRQVTLINQLSAQNQFVYQIEEISRTTISQMEALPANLLRRAVSGEIE